MPMQLFPLVLAAGRPEVLSLVDRDRTEGLAPGARYTVQIRPVRQLGPVVERELVVSDEGHLRFTETWAEPGEYILDLYATPHGDTALYQETERLARLYFFAAPADLYARRPLRCDFHIHSGYSDGRTPPVQMLIRARELGLDVAVVTDHNNYAGSIEAMAECQSLDLNLVTMPGEEVSAPDWNILSINADTGIYERMLGAFGLEGVDRAQREARLCEYDTLRWAVKEVQAHGGRAYLAHPYWAVARGFHLPTPLYDRILEEGILDGIELLGDVRLEDNLRSLARYLDLRATGRDIPIVGNSDTHRPGHTEGFFWTLAFVPAPAAGGRVAPEAVLEAIASGWSVACMVLPGPDPHGKDHVLGPAAPVRGGLLQAFGRFDLVDYAYFLEQQFFPRHDALCAEEAGLAYRMWNGEALPDDTMGACWAEMELFCEHCWGARRI